jgi:hypothetical protein
MRSYIWLITMGILLAVLPACTGSREEPARALLAASLNLADGTSEVRFFQSSSLQPGSFEPPRRVGSWAFGEPVVDLLYRRSLGVGNDQLWVLTPGHLRRYLTRNLGLENVGPPELDGFDQALNVDCARGYLRRGQGHVLLVCPPPLATPPRLIGEYQAWRIPFGATALPDPIDFRGPRLAHLTTPARFALDINDHLLYLTRTQFGWFNLRDQLVERPLPQPNLLPSDLVLAVNHGLGLLDDGDDRTTDTTLVSWNLSETGEVVPFPDGNIAARSFARGAPPIVVFGRGLAQFEAGSFRLPRPETNLRTPMARFRTAVAGIDQFLYIAERDRPTLWVADLTVRMDNLTTAGVRSSSLGIFGERITGLAFIPVD